MPDTHETGLREHMLMASRFLRNPRTVGAVSASSRALAEAMVAGIPTDRPVTVVELGPGTGAFTGAIVERIAPGSKLLAIDLEPTFVERIRRRWPSVDCVCASAADLEKLVNERHMNPVDHVVSGLPFASLPVAMTREVLDGIEHTLRPGGSFTTFQYVHGYFMPPGRTFRREMSERMHAAPGRQLVLKNFPFAFTLTWTRPAPAAKR
ncbi:MAG TPA: methyltransferase domain-containing protein [Vicinamibacterales bacterium]|nr:methyltransferase domain-containing protein [Vicinamibacterales bacterium]